MMIDLPPLDPAVEVIVASRGMSKGIAQSDGPQLVFKPFVKSGDVQLGAQWKNVSSSAASGEGAIFVGLTREVAKFQLSLQASHKFQTEVREPAEDHSWEFTGTISRKFGRLSVRAQAVYSRTTSAPRGDRSLSKAARPSTSTRSRSCRPTSADGAGSTVTTTPALTPAYPEQCSTASRSRPVTTARTAESLARITRTGWLPLPAGPSECSTA